MSRLRANVIIWLCAFHAVAESAVLISDITMSRMIELTSKLPYCKTHFDRGDIQRMLLASDQKRIRYVPMQMVQALEKECKQALANGLQSDIQGGLSFIYPQTKWCGPGSIASEYSDVGRYADEDRCCREHDLCPHTLAPGECKRGLCNHQQFTRSHCDCDAKFRRCLQGLNTETANTLGAVFFNVVQVTCFKERRPCSVYQSYSSQCPLEFYRSEPYTSLPLLSIVRTLSSNALFEPSGRHAVKESRSYYGYHDPVNSISKDDFTRDNSSTEQDHGIRLISLPFVARNIFKDIFVQRLDAIGRFLKFATHAWTR